MELLVRVTLCQFPMGVFIGHLVQRVFQLPQLFVSDMSGGQCYCFTFDQSPFDRYLAGDDENPERAPATLSSAFLGGMSDTPFGAPFLASRCSASYSGKSLNLTTLSSCAQ